MVQSISQQTDANYYSIHPTLPNILLGDEHHMVKTDLICAFHSEQRSKFRKGSLVRVWSDRYPELFDERDLELAKSQPNYHYFEWLTAVILYESTGYLSLLENYTAKSHPRKLELFESIVPAAVFEYCINNQSGLPDLFCFLPNSNQWLFCEVKGGPDQVRINQQIRMKELQDLTGKPVWIMNLREIHS